jgi:hypothetical protein
MTELPAEQVEVRGHASAEEIAAVLAVLSQRRAPGPTRYERWRAERLAALRRTWPR